MIDKNYASIATEYAEAVVAGEVIACKWVQAACQRQLKDLAKWEAGGFPYDWNPTLYDGEGIEYRPADRVCKFIELLPHIKGKWARERKLITLEPWQTFILTTIFGWVNKAGLRRFKTVYTEIPRKNAKSTLSSGVGLFCLAADGEEGAEVYSAATTRDQARIVWEVAKKMVDKSPGLRRRFGVEASAHSVYVEESTSSFKPLSRDQGGNHDGYSVACGIIDELHAHKTREIFDVIETGTGSREQPLIWVITTAGFNRAGICYEQRIYVTRILSGRVKDDEYFGIIYTLDEEDDLDAALSDPMLWQKANPNWCVSVDPDDIARKARKAREMASARNNFLTKHLNLWVNADTAWMDMVKWEQCGDEELTLDQFEGKPCYIAIDLASKLDIAPIAIIFREAEQYVGFVISYLPEETVENDSNSQYSGWAAEGHIRVTPGAVTDQGQIEEDLREFARRFDVKEIAYDPWQANYLATRLMDDGLPMIEYRQTVQNMSEPMKQWEALVVSGSFRHDANPVQTWMVSNVVCHTDAKENIYPRKEMPENKIDGPVATIMALGRAMIQQDDSAAFNEYLCNPVTPSG